MNNNTKFETIVNSFINGQQRQAKKQMKGKQKAFICYLLENREELENNYFNVDKTIINILTN